MFLVFYLMCIFGKKDLFIFSSKVESAKFHLFTEILQKSRHTIQFSLPPPLKKNNENYYKFIPITFNDLNVTNSDYSLFSLNLIGSAMFGAIFTLITRV